jgi:hypothetical protein
MTLQTAASYNPRHIGLRPVPGQPGLFYGPRPGERIRAGVAGALKSFFVSEPRDVVLEAACPSSVLGGLAGLFGLGATPAPRIRDFVNAADFGWYTLSPADKKKFGTINAWWQAYGKDNRISSRASFAATQAEKPNATPAEAQKWWGSIGKNARQRLRAKYTKGYGDNFLDDVAKVAKVAAQAVPVVGQAVSAGINVAQGQGAFKDPIKAATFLVGGPSAGQIAPFVSKKGLHLNEKALKQAFQSNIDMLKGASSGVSAKDIKLPNAVVPKMPDVAKLAKQGVPSAKALTQQINTVALSRAMSKASGLLPGSKAKSVASLNKIAATAKKQTQKTAAKNKDVVNLQKKLDALLAKERKEDKTQAAQLKKLQAELAKTRQEADTQNVIQKAVQEALARQAAMQPQYAPPPMYPQQYAQPPMYQQPFPGYAPQFAPQAQQMSMPQPTVYASQAMPQLSPEDYAAMQLPTSLSALHGVLV